MNEVQRLEMIKKSRDLVRDGAFTQEDYEIIKRRVICDKPMLFRSSLGTIKKAKELLAEAGWDGSYTIRSVYYTGNLLDTITVIQQFWWRWVFTATIFGITTISINLMGDGMRDAIDPKSLER